MSAPAETTAEVDAFMLPGRRKNVQWSIVRRTCFWAADMLVDGRPVSYTSLAARPDENDPLLNKIERNYFHEAS